MKQKTFLETYPGPYGYYPSTDGVDNTFNVYCRTTRRDIITSNYWDDVKEAERIAMVTSLALEAIRKSESELRYEAQLKCKLDEFRLAYPGPYGAVEFLHDRDRVSVGVTDPSINVLIIGITTVPHDRQSATVVRHVAQALNFLFDNPIDCRQLELPIHRVFCRGLR